MINTLHISGAFPLTVFIELNAIRLVKAHKIVAQSIDTDLYLTYIEEQPIYGFETHAYEFDLSGLQMVFINSTQTHVVFNGTTFAHTAHLQLNNCNNTLEFWNCAITNLCITTNSVNILNFEQQPMIDSVTASLSNTLVTGLKVRGGTVNNIDAHNNSAVQLSVGLAKGHQRTFDFHKDDSSMISVVYSKRGSREVLEEREL
jgi:hypothetical protein